MSKPKLTQQQFVTRAAARHHNFYDYAAVVYKGANEPVLIKCPIHGPFTKRPGSHLFGSGCALCGRIAGAQVKKQLLTQNVAWFIEKSKLVHAHKYDYSLVDYAAGAGKIKIGCPTHGVFEQTARKHRAGVGCPACRLANLSRSGKARAITTASFIARAQAVHGTTYDYAETACKTAQNKVRIRCLVHGVFEQKAANHLLGRGCIKCGWRATGEKSRLRQAHLAERRRGTTSLEASS